jgi:hypothetical protein
MLQWFISIGYEREVMVLPSWIGLTIERGSSALDIERGSEVKTRRSQRCLECVWIVFDSTK